MMRRKLRRMMRRVLLTLRLVKPTKNEALARMRMHLYGLDEFGD